MTDHSFRQTAQRLLSIITLLMVIGDIFMLLITKSVTVADSASYTDLHDRWYESGNFGISDKPISGEVKLHKDSTYFVHIDIPDDAEIMSRSCVCFISYACAFDLMVDNQIIYSYGKDMLREGRMIPRRVHYVSIPEDADSKNIKIIFIAGKNGATVNPESSYFGDVEVLSHVFLRKRAYAFFLCAFLITYGFLLIILSLVNGRHFKVALTTISQGLLLADLGLYISCYNDTFNYVTRLDSISAFVEYLSLISLPFLMQLVVLTNRKKYSNPLHIAVCVFDAFAIILCVVLHLTRIMHFNVMSPYIHGLMFIQGVYVFIWVRYIIIREKKTSRSFLFADAAEATTDFGLMALLTLSIVNLFLWSRGIYHLELLNSDVKGNFIILGSLIFAGCVTLGYFFHSLGTMHEKEIYQALTDAAYTDELTGVKNRAFCDYMEQQWIDHDMHGGIITLDLDGLKKINDNIGHEAGDRYIASFAAILSDVKPQFSVVCRTGGDEFVILLPDFDMTACEMTMKKIENSIDDHNKKDKEMPIYYSVGAACTDEITDGDINETFQLSDARMYEMKDEHHRQGKGGRA